MRRALALVALALAGCRAAAVYSCEPARERAAFVVFGDSRQALPAESARVWAAPLRRAIVERIAAARPALVVSTGDLVSVGTSGPSWRRFDDEMAPLADAGIAFVPALGNHDLWPDAEDSLVHWFERFPFLDARTWFSVRHLDVDIVVLDSNTEHLSPAQEDAQTSWFEEELARDEVDPSVRAVVVVLHHSPITNSVATASCADVTARFVEPALRWRKVRAFFTGHVHSYEHFVRNRVHFVVTGGGGAPLMHVDGPAGANADLYDGPRGHHFCLVTRRGDGLVVEVHMLGDDGSWSVADRFEIPFAP